MTQSEVQEMRANLDEMFIGYLMTKIDPTEYDGVYSTYINLRALLHVKDKPPEQLPNQ